MVQIIVPLEKRPHHSTQLVTTRPYCYISFPRLITNALSYRLTNFSNLSLLVSQSFSPLSTFSFSPPLYDSFPCLPSPPPFLVLHNRCCYNMTWRRCLEEKNKVGTPADFAACLSSLYRPIRFSRLRSSSSSYSLRPMSASMTFSPPMGIEEVIVWTLLRVSVCEGGRFEKTACRRHIDNAFP